MKFGLLDEDGRGASAKSSQCELKNSKMAAFSHLALVSLAPVPQNA